MTETVGIAVVGTGDWGANLVRNFAALPGARLVALCDTDPGRLARTAARHPGVLATARVEEVAAHPEVRGVVVAASAVQHYPIARTLLEASRCPILRAFMEREIERVNAALARFETVRKFQVLPAEFTVGGGELTPTLKLKRKAVYEKFATEIEALYG